MNNDAFYCLHGTSVYFKALSLEDAEEIHAYASNENVSRFIGWKLMKNIDETHAHIEKMISQESEKTHVYASVVLQSTDEIVGTMILFNFDPIANYGEIGYVFHQKHWGKGYGTEATALACNYAFKNLKLHKLQARVVDANIPSFKVLEKNGFELEGRLKDHYYIDGKYYDCLWYGKINPDEKNNE